MAVLVDECVWPWQGRTWCHLVTDAHLDELHLVAERLGLPRRAFQGDHYDLDEELRAEAVALGAEELSGRDLVLRLVASGLRLTPAVRRSLPGVPVPELEVRALDPVRDHEVARRHLAAVPGGEALWWAEWGRTGDVAVIADDGNRVGLALCRVIAPGEPGAIAVAVARPMRGRGVGRSLLAGLCELAAAAGHHALVVAAPPDGAVVERLARAAGFEAAVPGGLLHRRLR